MTATRRTAVAALAVAAGAFVLPLPAAQGQEASAGSTQARSVVVASSLTLSADEASLRLELAGGETHHVEFRGGQVVVDGETVGSYEPGGGLERSWRELLVGGVGEVGAVTLDAERLRGWSPPAGAAGGAGGAVDRALERWLAPPEPAADAGRDTGEAVAMRGPDGEQLAIAPGRVSLAQLARSLNRLQRSLSVLGEDAGEAASDLALVVHDDYEIARGRQVVGNLALLGGELRLGGHVAGDVLVLDGTLLLEPAARVDGDVFQVGGEVLRQGGQVAGEFLSVQPASPGEDGAPGVEPSAGTDAGERLEEMRRRLHQLERQGRSGPGFFGSVAHNVGRSVAGVLGVAGVYILLGLAGALSVYFVRERLEVVADTARHSLGRSFGVGLAGQFLFFPVLLVLVVAVITLLVVPFYVAAGALAALGGFLATAHTAGEMLAQSRFRYEWLERLRRSNSYYYVFSGVAVFLLPFALAEAFYIFGGWLGFLRGFLRFLGVVGVWLAGTVGFGAVLLSRAGERTEYAAPTPEAGARSGAA